MKITNYKNLPESLVKAITFDDYSKGDATISVTSLWKSPRVVELESKYADHITQDASEMIWVLFGKCIHEILRRSDTKALTETRLSEEILGWKVSGQFDRFVEEDGLLQDYKITSAWTLVFDSRHKDWTNQLNSYAHLLRKQGHKVKRIEVVAILRDWSAREARTKPDYPQSPVQIISLDLWDYDKTQALLEEQVRKHIDGKLNLPLCTEEEQWAKPTVYAVMKEGRKSALSLCMTQDQANKEKEGLGHEHGVNKVYIEVRPGEKTKCESYCSVKKFCSQYAGEQLTKSKP